MRVRLKVQLSLVVLGWLLSSAAAGAGGRVPPQSPTPASEAAGLLEEGKQWVVTFDFAAAERRFQRAVDLAQQHGETAVQAAACEQLGILYRDTGRFQPAQASYECALALYVQQLEAGKVAAVRFEIGSVNDQAGHFSAAISSYRLALADESAAPATRLEALAALVGIYARLGGPRAALDVLRSQISKAPSTFSGRRMAILEGDLETQDDHPREALAAYDRALAVDAAAEPAADARMLATKRGLAYLRLHDLAAAEALKRSSLADAEAAFRQADDPLGLAQVGLLRHQAEAARELVVSAEARAEAAGDLRQLFACRMGDAESILASDPAATAAEPALVKAVASLEEYRATLPTGQRIAFLADSTHGYSHLAAYRELIDLLARRGEADEAFRYSEYIQARLLAETLEGTAHPREQQLLLLPEQPMVPLSRIRGPLSKSGVYMPALFNLMTESIYGVPEEGKAQERDAAVLGLLAGAGYDRQALESVRRKIELFRANGLKNHLTSSPTGQPAAKSEGQP